MEFKDSITSFFLLFLLLALPYISRGAGRMRLADSEIYEIDYRGPETHSSVMPPPGRSHGRPIINEPKSSSSRGGEGNGDDEKKTHG